MKLLYIASIRLPTEKAHGIQIMKTCEAFSKIGIEVNLAVPEFFLFDSNKSDPFLYYDVARVFKIKRIWSLRLIRLGPVGFFLETFLFSFGLLFSSDFWKADYIFSRDEMLISVASFLGRKTIWETHTGSYNFFARQALKKSKIIVSISQGLKDFYISKGVSESKIIVSRDGVDLEDFNITQTKTEAKEILNLPQDKKIVLYAGRLDGWKGVETFFEASKKFSEDTIAVVVGGDRNQITEFSKKYPHILFVGYKPYKELPMYQRSADVLVIPNTGKSEVSKVYTSPLKLFSYMASGRPIVASDLPSIREVLNTSNSILVSPDSPEAIIKGVNKALEDENKADIMAKQALSDVKRYSWDSRDRKILDAIENLKI